MQGRINWNWGGIAIIAVILALTALVTSDLFRSKGRTVSASATSPDVRWRALLVEFDDGRMDRNFEVYLETASTRERRLIFSSPDEGRPIGTERFIWSKDGRHVLLVGRHFGITDGADTLDTGEQLYALYDTLAGKLYCNARQQNHHPPFLKKDVREIDWLTPLKTSGDK